MSYTRTTKDSGRKMQRSKKSMNSPSKADANNYSNNSKLKDKMITGNLYNNGLNSVMTETLTMTNAIEGTKNLSTSRSRKGDSANHLTKVSEKSTKKIKDKVVANFFHRNLTRAMIKRPNSSTKNKRNSASLKKKSELCLSLHNKIMGKILKTGNNRTSGNFTDRESYKKPKKPKIDLVG